MQGQRILLTRAAEDLPPLAEAVAQRGGVPLLLPCIRIGPAPDPKALFAAAKDIESYDAIVVGSKNATKTLARALFARGKGTEVPVYVVGAKTAARLRRDDEMQAAFRGPLHVPQTFRAESLVELMQANFTSLAGRRFLFPRAPEGREVIIDALEAGGATVDALLAYQIESAAPADEAQRALASSADIITFFSGRTLDGFIDVIGEAEARAMLARTRVAILGPVAAEHAASRQIRVDVIPKRATAEDLFDALSP